MLLQNCSATSVHVTVATAVIFDIWLLFKFRLGTVCVHFVCLLCLVKSLTQVKITDFGLAKVLEHNQDQIYGSGGKVMFTG